MCGDLSYRLKNMMMKRLMEGKMSRNHQCVCLCEPASLMLEYQVICVFLTHTDYLREYPHIPTTAGGHRCVSPLRREPPLRCCIVGNNS